ncbi:sensor histidine kinase [Elstera litoralis]|uniref:sensor histidine kinase n=1 Tax=Elstera litoralis TaxID=552518 RepID=UPI00069607BA|nr:sensor histidine kinase [Elstera litoralis]
MERIDRRFLSYNIIFSVLAAAILVFIALGAFWTGEKTKVQMHQALQAAAVDQAIGGVLDAVLDAETGQRGYLLTRDEAYLTPYRDAKARYQAALEAVDRHLALLPPPYRFPSMLRLRAVTQQKFEEMEFTLDLAKVDNIDSILTIVRGNRGRILMDEIRGIVADLQTGTSDLQRTRSDDVAASAALLTGLTASGAVAVVILAVCAILVIVRHTQEIESARLALARANTELEQRVLERTEGLARANDELQRYAYIVTHDLRAPLVNIMGFTSELETATATFAAYLQHSAPDRSDTAVAPVFLAVEEDIPEALQFIRTSMTRMDALINEILKLSRLGRVPLVPRPVTMTALCAECIANLRHRLTDLGAEITLIPPLPMPISDEASLRQIMMNLLDNAVKYLDPTRPGQIFVRGHGAGRLLVFEVEDNGRGIAPADHERVFELFRRAGTQDQPGEGIGLAHVRTLVRRLGGDIRVLSDGRTGTVFRFTIASDLRSTLGSTETGAAA